MNLRKLLIITLRTKEASIGFDHSSYANECKKWLASNERLEFWVMVLEMVVSEHIYLNSTYYSEVK